MVALKEQVSMVRWDSLLLPDSHQTTPIKYYNNNYHLRASNTEVYHSEVYDTSDPWSILVPFYSCTVVYQVLSILITDKKRVEIIYILSI